MDYNERESELVPARRPPLMVLPDSGPAEFALTPTMEPQSSLHHFVELLIRHKWTIGAFVMVAMIVAGVVSRLLQPLYESTAVVRIDRRVTGGAVGLESSAMSPVNDMDQVMATQLEVLQSDPVLRPVADKYHLRELEKQFAGLTPDQIRAKRAAPVVLDRLKVMRPPNTYLIRITYRAMSPGLAAEVANDIADSYIRHAFDSRDTAYTQVAASIQNELAALRTKMEASSGTLAGFEKELNLVDPEQGSTIQAARLKQLNEEFTKAQTERLSKEAILKALRDADTVPAAQASAQGQSLDRALERLDEARQQFAAVRAVYGDNYSEYRKARDQVDELQKQVEQLRAGIGDRVKVEYQQASGKEQRLQAVVDSAKAEVDRLSARALQYAQMKRDADNDRRLYEDLQRRTAEEDINHRFQDAVIQISEAALPAYKKIFPNTLMNLAVAFVLSLAFGIVWVVLADAVDTTLSDPEDVARRLNVEVLGMIPATRSLANAAAAAAGRPLSRHSAEASERFLESIRGLRTSIGLANLDRPVKSILVASAEPGEGKSTTAANLALSFAQIGKRVLLVDADLRAPTAHRQFQIGSGVGLSDVLTGRAKWREAMVRIESYPLYVVPAGPVSRRASDMITSVASDLFDQVSRVSAM
jgi:uncharacterized protein involved in exopolysaccharide biosynthesis